jgi:hypothetical protein
MASAMEALGAMAMGSPIIRSWMRMVFPQSKTGADIVRRGVGTETLFGPIYSGFREGMQ